MTQIRDIQPALRHLEAALEANCATLVALESAKIPDGQDRTGGSAAQVQIRSAIASVRNAISVLRAPHDVEMSLLAYGFVLADREWSGDERGPLSPDKPEDA